MKAKQYLAAFLVAAMAGNPLMTAFAAEESRDGMQLNEDGQWNYYKDGEMVSGEIVKVRYNGANNRYYFDEDGVMARNELFEYEGETMYAYPNGTLAKNGWVLLDEDTGEITTDSEQGRWYYFDSDRHQVKDGKIRLNEKKGTHWYRFEDGDMIKSRWVEESGLDDYEGDPEDDEEWHYYEYYGWEARNKWLYLNDGSGDEAWYEFDSQGRMATDSDAKKAPKDRVKAVRLPEDADDTVEMKVGQKATVKFDVVLASDSDASLTKNHDFWSEDIDPEFDVEAAVIYNKTEDWSADGTYTITYEPRYPGQVSIKAVIDGRESKAVTFISEWANEETQKAETIGTIIDEHKSDEGDVLGTVQSIREISASMDSRESLLDGWSEKAGSLETLENDYLIAAGIVKTEEVTDEAQELLRSGGVQIVGAGLNSEDYGELVFTVDKGEDVDLEESYDSQVAFDLTLTQNGSEITDLVIPAIVTMPVPSGLDSNGLVLYHDHGGEVTPVDIQVSGNKVTFVTDGFSNYIFAGKAAGEGGSSSGGSDSPGGSGSSSSSSASGGAGSGAHASIPATPGQWSRTADGRWQFLNSAGNAYADTWIYVQNQWYWVDGTGTMLTGWLLRGDKWYYLDASGAMVTGWLQYGGTWYYMGQDGTMLTDTVTPDQYRVGADGALVE